MKKCKFIIFYKKTLHKKLLTTQNCNYNHNHQNSSKNVQIRFGIIGKRN